jgi:hypothetical protein
VALVSESAARKVWPLDNPVGKMIVNDPRSDRVTVIGVVADVRTESLEKQPPPIVYGSLLGWTDLVGKRLGQCHVCFNQPGSFPS